MFRLLACRPRKTAHQNNSFNVHLVTEGSPLVHLNHLRLPAALSRCPCEEKNANDLILSAGTENTLPTTLLLLPSRSVLSSHVCMPTQSLMPKTYVAPPLFPLTTTPLFPLLHRWPFFSCSQSPHRLAGRNPAATPAAPALSESLSHAQKPVALAPPG